MRPLRLSHSIVAMLVLLGAVMLPLVPSTALAAARGSIVLHPRLCPFNLGPTDDLFGACHDTPGPDDVTFAIDERRDKGLDADGNVSFGRVTAGDHLVILTTDYQPNEFLRLVVFCTNISPTVGVSGPNEAAVRSTEQASFSVRVGAGAKLVCDVYFLREGGADVGSIVVHPRLCPFDLGPEDGLFAACHDDAGPDDVTFAVDGGPDAGLDDDGNVSLGQVEAGDHLIAMTTDYQPNEFLRLRVLCSNIDLATGVTSGPNEATVLATAEASFYVRVGAGSELVCDVYFLRESGR